MDSNIEQSENILGASDVLCPRHTILKNLNGNDFKGNAKTLGGKLYERALYEKPVLDRFINQIDAKLGVISKVKDTTREDYIHFFDEYKKRLHPDIYTEHYIVEVKTTYMPAKMWVKETADYQVEQLNTYLGYYRKKIGFLHKVNMIAFKSDRSDWDDLWKNYGFTIPVIFNEELFRLTQLRDYNLFKLIKQGKFDVKGPCKPWECASCDTIEECGKVKVRCNQRRNDKPHYYFMYEWESTLTDEFLNDPYCHLCYADSRKRKPYLEYKYKQEYRKWFKERE